QRRRACVLLRIVPGPARLGQLRPGGDRRVPRHRQRANRPSVRSLAVAAGLLILSTTVPAHAQSSGSRVIGVQRRVIDVQYRIGEAPGETTVESGAQAQLILAADVLFAFDKADLTPAASQALQVAADHVRGEAKGPVHIDGYTDAVGNAAYN